MRARPQHRGFAKARPSRAGGPGRLDKSTKVARCVPSSVRRRVREHSFHLGRNALIREVVHRCNHGRCDFSRLSSPATNPPNRSAPVAPHGSQHPTESRALAIHKKNHNSIPVDRAICAIGRRGLSLRSTSKSSFCHPIESSISRLICNSPRKSIRSLKSRISMSPPRRSGCTREPNR